MKQIKQYRYYGKGNANTYPSDLDDAKLTSGNLFDGIAISQLGIQGRPNTCFYLNDSVFPIVLGETGIYELDLDTSKLVYVSNIKGVITFIRSCVSN